MLTRAAGPDNLARLAQFVGLLAGSSTKSSPASGGGGVPYSAYPEFHTLMAEDSKARVRACWSACRPPRRRTARPTEAGIPVADIGCGTGQPLNVLAHVPSQPFMGNDFSEEAIGARADSPDARPHQCVVHRPGRLAVAGPAPTTSSPPSTPSTTRPTPRRTGERLSRRSPRRRVPDGRRPSLEPARRQRRCPFAPYLYGVSPIHCMTVSLGLDGDGLGTVWGRQLATSMLADVGFGDVQVREIESDPINYYYVARK